MKPTQSVHRIALFGAIALAAAGWTGCATYTGAGAVSGSLLGAGAGALIGSTAGHAGTGALIGAGAGALLGGIVGEGIEHQRNIEANSARRYEYDQREYSEPRPRYERYRPPAYEYRERPPLVRHYYYYDDPYYRRPIVPWPFGCLSFGFGYRHGY